MVSLKVRIPIRDQSRVYGRSGHVLVRRKASSNVDTSPMPRHPIGKCESSLYDAH